MGKATKRSSANKPGADNASNASKLRTKPTRKSGTSSGWSRSWMVLLLVFALVLVYVACLYHFSSKDKEDGSSQDAGSEREKAKTRQTGSKPSSRTTKSKNAKASNTQSKDSNLPPEFKDFKLSVQKELKMTPIKIDGKPLKIQQVKHTNSKSSVKAYLIENFLGDYECDNLIRVHKKFLEMLNKNDPIMCFDSVDTLAKNLKELKLKFKVSPNDFTTGTTCLNETFSSKLKQFFEWSYSMAFYPEENKFSTMYAKRIQHATGLKEENGGKFQITAYPVGVGYKSHTDCVVYEGEGEKRDRYATILVYLQDVEEGGETDFPLLGIKVKPKKGLALVWNSMDEHGNCDPLSLHDAKQVTKGHKYIIQRWYYYHNFPSLGKRPREPSLPARKQGQPRVSCDMYEQGSCRWYDEWNYDHIIEYAANTRQWV